MIFPSSAPWGRQAAGRNWFFPPQEVGGEDAHADDGRKPRGKGCPENPHVPWEDEHPVQHHIGEAAADHGRHGELGSPVVADKAQQKVVQQERRGKEEDHPQVGFRHGEHSPRAPKQPGNIPGKQEPHRHKEGRQPRRQIEPVGENPVRLPVVPLAF